MAVDNWVSAHLDKLVAFRRDLHSNPELLYDLPRTAAEVASASQEQTKGIVQINSAVAQMDKVTQGNAASAEESAAAAQELNQQAMAMKKAVEDLLILVGQQAADTRPTPAAHAPTVAESKPSQVMNGAHKNGESTPSAKKDRSSEIPLENAFRDF